MKKTTVVVDQKKEWVLFLVLLLLFFAYWYFILSKKKSEQSSQQQNETALLMSVNELKSYKGFENISETDGTSYIRSMQDFCMITHELYKQEKSKTDAKES